MKNKLTLTGANKLFFAFTVVFLAYQFIAAFFLGEVLYDNIYTIIIINEVLVASFVLIYCFARKIDIRETFRIKKLGLAPALFITLLSVPLFLAATMLNNFVVYGLQFIADLPPQSLPVPKTPGELAVAVLITGVMPGVCEELMHRGFLLTAYERRGSYRAVVIVAILFGLFHFDIMNLLGPIFLGAVFGYYVIRTDSIFAGILAHFLNNAIVVVIQYLWGDPSSVESLSLSWQELLGIITIGVPALAVAAVLLFLFKQITEGKTRIVQPVSRPGKDVKTVLSHWPIAAVMVLYIIMAILNLVLMMLMKFFTLQ
ncbi:MAG: type II CAAX endopeptidase family protein [Acetivibrionales bacterium]|jgi:membrane protease YdiL (CAAX protease family)|nr:type II CAAX endopeptidase family protein [Bacillota bacterium]NLP07988.1 CPBP family intramembrane metalloprotease [Clostridiaceae bacterium]HOA55277.1 type II CAAX endopeptidase family protein [Clostridiales bacterium]HPZ06104.1 type II CAAX endopeptidase family protein [Clostridiales bacterium]HQD30291.1 type II CAAX endopeptidase family protein [Clostridiales bacterium]